MSDRFANLSPLQRAYLAIEDLQAKLAAAEKERTEPIAIVGIGCRYPGGVDSPHSFWPLLRDGFDAITEVPPERWDVNLYYDPDPSKPGKMCTRWGGFIEGVDRFDAPFFNISPREATLMDPQQRLLLEVAAEALDDAGQSNTRLAGSRTGVFVGIYNTDYLRFQHQDEAYAAIGNSLGIAAGRLAYTFDLQGPTMLIDTLCSSSLVAVSLACHSLRQRECNLALAGGVNLILSPVSTIMASRLMALAPDGRCKTFDARANGFVRSEGCGMVVLKRLSEALADRDPVWAVVRGAAVNQDGRSTALTAPNVLAQQAVIRQALGDAGVLPEQVDYIEAHGTGTPLGDPIEIEALKAVYGRPRPEGEVCSIGSVKTNLGHTEAAAGIAGLIKTALALKHAVIPPHVNFHDLNPRIDLNGTPFVIPTQERPWPVKDKQSRFAAVSSFGLSGTNAHVVLEQAPPATVEPEAQEAGRTFLLPLSARNPEALRARAEAVHGRLADAGGSIRDLCYTAGLRRTHYEERVAVSGTSAAELQSGLKAFLDHGRKSGGSRKKVAFVFSGHGGQYLGMGRELFRDEPVFRKALETCDRALRAHVEWSLCELLALPDGEWQQNIGKIQPATFAIQVALFELWRSWGIRPHAVVGHSMGEVAAAYAAGAINLEHAAQIISRRSALLEGTRGHGATLLIDLPQRDVERAIAGEKALSVAACNGPRSTVVAGEAAAVSGLMDRLQLQNVFCKQVRIDVAAHTSYIDSLGGAVPAAFEGVTGRPGEIPFYSSVHGRLLPGAQCGSSYWTENVRRPVQFWKALQSLIHDGHGLFVEIGPHPVLSISIADGLKFLEAEGEARPSLRRGQPERGSLLETLAALYEYSQPVSWAALFPTGGRQVSLPPYPWQRERYWVDPPSGNSPWLAALDRQDTPGTHGAMGGHRELSSPAGTFLWEFEPTVAAWPYLADHRVQGMVVVPAAAFIELALAGAAAVIDRGYTTLEKIQLQQMLILRDESRRLVQLVMRRKDGAAVEFQFASRNLDQTGEWTVHALGSIALAQAGSEAAMDTARAEIQQRCDERLSPPAYYDALAAAGLEYGPAFRAVAGLQRRDSEALARLEAPAAIRAVTADYLLHPALLDSCFQVFAAALPREISEDGALYLPVGVGKIQHYGPPPDGPLWVHARVSSNADRSASKIEGDLQLLADDGRVIADIRQFAVQRLALPGADDAASGWLYQTVWRRQDRTEAAAADLGTTLILVSQPSMGLGAQLQENLIGRGGNCVVGTAGMLSELLRATRNNPQPLQRVVYVAETAPVAGEPAASALERCSELLQVVQTLAEAGFRDAPRLWLLTRGAQAAGAGDRVSAVADSSLWGFGATLALEHPEFLCGRIDLNPEPLNDELEQVAGEICGAGREAQIALRADGRYVARLVRYSEAQADDRPAPSLPAGERNFRLEISSPGILDNLKLRQAPRREPGPGEIEIEVHAAGLNFLDVLSAMGLKPGDDAGPVLLGGECSGLVSAVGEGVRGLRPGDAVVAIAPSSFARFVITRAEFAVRKPDSLSHEQAATIPVAFLTAYYALHELGHIQRGERILIHSASGGTGLAAVQLAQRAGAEIFATAGNEEKREFLRALGIAHVMDSRSLAFADQIHGITGGRGVDLILNSLAGEAIDKSLSVLAPEGRFLEIGKKDIYQDYRLGLLPFRKGLAYFAIDLAGLALRRPAVISALFEKLMGEFAGGRLEPLPLHAYPMRDAVSAFHTMAQAKHTGKLVLTPAGAAQTPIEPSAGANVQIRNDGAYLITGGLGGVGLAIAEWLVEQGAGALFLIGRRAPGAAAAAKIDLLRTHGAKIEVMQADVADALALAAILQDAKNRLPPLRGIVHAAAVLEDATVMRLNEGNFKSVFAPKVAGAWNLHLLAGEHELDFFVLFSSAASVLGSPGQANYSAANAFLDALAHHRRSLGKTALSINWGPWAEVGLAAAQENRGQRLAAMGIESIPPRQGAAVFGRLLSQTAAQVAVMPFRLRVWRQLSPAAAGVPFFSELVEDSTGQEQGRGTSKLRAALLAEEAGKRAALLEEHLADQIAQVLRTSAARISRDTPFNTLGMDSLMGLELRNRLESSLGVSLQATLVWSHPTIGQLAPHLAEKIGVALQDEQPGSPPAPIITEADVATDDLTEHDASALLAEKLAALDDEYLS